MEDSLRAFKVKRQKFIDSVENLFPRITYHKLQISNAHILDSIRTNFGKTRKTWTKYRVLTLLNRKDIQFVRIGDNLVLPDTFVSDLRAYSIFPVWYEGGERVDKIVFISNKWQCYACYKYGLLVRFAAANTGEEGKPTLPGRYAVNWKQRKRISSLDSTWILPFTVNFHQYAGNAFHQFEMPGRPVSHSCVRQFLSDAEWLYHWVRPARLDSNKRPIMFTGTPVIITDVFDFSKKRGGPWLELSSNKDMSIKLPNNPMETEEALIPISQIPKDVRGALTDINRYKSAEKILRERGVLRENARLKVSVDFNKLRRDKKRKKQLEEARLHEMQLNKTD
ncbi:MAG: L,D-transpeptidase [Ignavibacteria bacterium]|nr:L,D-transpeptidase [Ignavibacteria bacterium]